MSWFGSPRRDRDEPRGLPSLSAELGLRQPEPPAPPPTDRPYGPPPTDRPFGPPPTHRPFAPPPHTDLPTLPSQAPLVETPPAALEPEPYAPPVAAPPAAPPQERAHRTARREGRQVASLRCLETSGEFLVECEVYPVSTVTVDPLRPGPYRFGSMQDANGFLDEAVLALKYLGCDVA